VYFVELGEGEEDQWLVGIGRLISCCSSSSERSLKMERASGCGPCGGRLGASFTQGFYRGGACSEHTLASVDGGGG
jgi:hypothetical protein